MQEENSGCPLLLRGFHSCFTLRIVIPITTRMIIKYCERNTIPSTCHDSLYSLFRGMLCSKFISAIFEDFPSVSYSSSFIKLS